MIIEQFLSGTYQKYIPCRSDDRTEHIPDTVTIFAVYFKIQELSTYHIRRANLGNREGQDDRIQHSRHPCVPHGVESNHRLNGGEAKPQEDQREQHFGVQKGKLGCSG